MRALPLVLVVLSTPAFAADYSAGGVMLSSAGLGSVGRDGMNAGTLPCLGGTGWGVQGSLRTGGEGQFCRNSTSAMTYGGAETGWQNNLFGIAYGGGTMGLGGGWVTVENTDLGRYRAAFLYAKPKLEVGVPVWIGAVELSVYAMLPLPVFTEVKGDTLRPMGAFPFVGTELTFLAGNFYDRKKKHEDPPEPPAEDDRPVDAPPVDAPPAPPPHETVDPRDHNDESYEDDDGRPLAIPGDAPPPRR